MNDTTVRTLTPRRVIRVLDAWLATYANPGASYKVRAEVTGARGNRKTRWVVTLAPDYWPSRFYGESPDSARLAAAESLLARNPDLAADEETLP